MPKTEEAPLADLKPELQRTNAMKIRVVGNAKQAASVLHTLNDNRTPARNYSITKGDDVEHSWMITVMEPLESAVTFETHTGGTTERIFAKNSAVLEFSDALDVSRRHFRGIPNLSHPDAGFLQQAVSDLGGQVQGRQKKMKLTTDAATLSQLEAFVRGAPEILERAKVGSPFISAVKEEPRPSGMDVTNDPDFAPEAVRQVLKIEIAVPPDLGHDATILDILERRGLSVSTVGSRFFHTKTDGEIQELTIMMHGGSNETVQKAIADITILIGVRHVDRIEEANAAQYIQLVVPESGERSIPEIRAHYRGLLRDKGAMTDRFQHLVAGTMPLHFVADLRRRVASTFGNRQNSVILPNDGNIVMATEMRGLGNDNYAELIQQEFSESQRKGLRSFIDGRNRDL